MTRAQQRWLVVRLAALLVLLTVLAASAMSFALVPSMRFGAVVGSLLGGVEWVALTGLLTHSARAGWLMGACGGLVGAWAGRGMSAQTTTGFLLPFSPAAPRTASPTTPMAWCAAREQSQPVACPLRSAGYLRRYAVSRRALVRLTGCDFATKPGHGMSASYRVMWVFDGMEKRVRGQGDG